MTSRYFYVGGKRSGTLDLGFESPLLAGVLVHSILRLKIDTQKTNEIIH